MKAKVQHLRERIRSKLDEGVLGAALVRHISDAADEIVCELWKESMHKHGDIQGVDLIAVGGYGRQEVCPSSDWDVWFICEDEHDSRLNAAIQTFMNPLWDAKVQVGYAVRSVRETEKIVFDDLTSRTSLLESRLIIGEGKLYQDLMTQFWKKMSSTRQKKKFVREKLEEIRLRRSGAGSTPFLMEPNIKEGRGGLRDIQTIYWLCKAWSGGDSRPNKSILKHMSEQEFTVLQHAQNFLFLCRCHLHMHYGRENDQMDFEVQPLIAEAFGFETGPHQQSVEQFMKQYFVYAKRVSDLTDIFVMQFESLLSPMYMRGRKKKIDDFFYLRGRWIYPKNENVFSENPVNLFHIFRLAQDDRRRLSGEALRLIRKHADLIDESVRHDARVHHLFLDILRQPRNVAWALREMNKTGVLGNFIPEFGRIVAHGQFDRYHKYTVDEHTIRAVAEIRNFKLGRDEPEKLELPAQIMAQIKRPEILFLGVLFHDIAKGSGKDHSVEGARLVHNFARQLGVSVDGSDLAAWLVNQHLLMAKTSQRYDISDPQVIRNFSDAVGDLERLQYLYLLTVADIRAVGPGVWNDWKGSLLEELYRLSEVYLLTRKDKPAALEERLAVRIQDVKALANRDGVISDAIEATLRAFPSPCITSFPPEQLYKMAQLVLATQQDDYGVDIYTDQCRGDSEIFIVGQDRAGLFSDLVQAISSAHINIVASKAYTLKDGRILDAFHVQTTAGLPLVEQADQDQLHRRVLDALAGRGRSIGSPSVPSNIHMKQQGVRVRALPYASSKETVIELVAADRPGLLASVVLIIDQQGFAIHGASISTFGAKAVDVFFLTKNEGESLDEAEIRALCAKLESTAFLQGGE